MVAYPSSRRDSVIEMIHGVAVADPYRWLEDGSSAETRAWIASQQVFARRYFATPERERLRRQLAELMKVDTLSTPIERGGWYFYVHRVAGAQQGTICRRRGFDGAEEALVDPIALDKSGLTSVEVIDVTPNGSLLAYSVRHGGEDEHEIRVLDVGARRDLPDLLPRARYYQNLSWRHDRSGFYYFVFGAKRSVIRFHRLGTSLADDREIFASPTGTAMDARVSDDDRYLLITIYLGAAGNTEIYCKRLDFDGPPLPIVTGLHAASYANYGDDCLFILTNWKAPNWRVIRIELSNPLREAWREVIPETSSPLTTLATAGGHLVAVYLETVHARVRIFTPDGTAIRDVELPADGTADGQVARWSSPELFFSFQSFTVPPTIYQCDVRTGALTTWWRQDAPDLSGFEVHQEWFTSKDGTQVPMFLFHRKGLAHDGARPTLLFGYGGFNGMSTPFYWPAGLTLAEQDGIFVEINLRGGGEFGERWHQAGMLERKQNVFDDFVAAAEWLISNNYTNAAKLAAIGASNGGLLMGAALTQRHDLFHAIVCWAPVLDMIRYHHHPLGPMWIPEYGCSDDADQFLYLLAYSPYHNVREGVRYPAVMFVTGDADTRADPMHARKMTAVLQHATGAGDHPILLHYRAEAGHMANLAIDAAIDEAADQMAFVFRELGVTPR